MANAEHRHPEKGYFWMGTEKAAAEQKKVPCEHCSHGTWGFVNNLEHSKFLRH
jgi:hypothetical protein